MEHFRVKVYSPIGLSEHTVGLLSSQVQPGINLAQAMGRTLLTHFDQSKMSFGVSLFGWAPPRFALQLVGCFSRAQSITAINSDVPIASIGGSREGDGMVVQYSFGSPLSELDSASVVQHLEAVDPFANQERTERILEWCKRNVVTRCGSGDEVVFVYAVRATSKRLAERVISQVCKLLNQEPERSKRTA